MWILIALQSISRMKMFLRVSSNEILFGSNFVFYAFVNGFAMSDEMHL